MNPQPAIAGIGDTEFSKASGRSELRLAAEAVVGALADAGLTPRDVDGMVSLSMDNTDASALSRALGIESLTLFAHVPWGGGGACGTVALAGAAIRAGMARVVVCYRAMNERSQQRFGRPVAPGESNVPTSIDLDFAWAVPFGMATAAAFLAPCARRYMHDYGATSEDFGRVTVAARAFAATNAAAWFYEKPITLEDHQASRLVADPFRLLDCCQESDGAVALVLTSLDRARDLHSTPVVVAGAAQGMAGDQVALGSPYRPVISGAPETAIVGRQLWAQTGLDPHDMDGAIIYDHFSYAVLAQLEALGFCGPGEAPGLVASGATGPGGRLPVNPNGGQLGEAYIHGFNGMAEAVRQVRGKAVNQIRDLETIVVTAGSHVPTSGLVLTADR